MLPLDEGEAMRRGALVLAGLVALILVVGSLPAAAYVDAGYGPQGDSRAPSGDYDIRSTVRSVERGRQRRILEVEVRTYDGHLGPDAVLYIEVRLDAKGKRTWDARLGMSLNGGDPDGCGISARSGRFLGVGRLRFPDPESIACRVGVARLHPTKTIGWNVIIRWGYDVYDVAPARGLYR
jgi:hypothetical protein